ncbi:MAG: hypothetical protein IJS37_03750 [Bacilli bacterium]|nr:hypothetical protein [Bacilli bacterium]
MTFYEIISLVIAGISAIAACVSAIGAFLAKAEVKKLKTELRDVNLRAKTNSGFMAGLVQGDVYEK